MAKEKKQQPRMQELYEKEIIPKMIAEFGLKNKMAVPKIKKISLNVGIGRFMQKDTKISEQIINNLAKITGQRPVVANAKKSIAAFKLREGMPVGVRVTLRGARMYEFLDRLINVALPRIRDFRGLSGNAFDQDGNYSIGLKEHAVFPEIILEGAEMTHGLQINITLDKKDKKMGTALLKYFGLPFKK